MRLSSSRASFFGSVLAIALGVFLLFSPGLARAQSALDGLPWTIGSDFNNRVHSCGPTMSATECANENAAWACGTGATGKCGVTAVSCAVYSTVADNCTM